MLVRVLNLYLKKYYFSDNYQVTGRHDFTGDMILLTNNIVVHHWWRQAATSKPFDVGKIGPWPIHEVKFILISNTNTNVGIKRQ